MAEQEPEAPATLARRAESADRQSFGMTAMELICLLYSVIKPTLATTQAAEIWHGVVWQE